MKRLGIVLFFLATAAHGWTPASDEKIARKAANLAPPDLRMILKKYEGDYKTGLARARVEEGNLTHRYFVATRDGRLRERIESETAGAVRAIRQGDPMSKVVERLGTLAHLVADANNPFNVAKDDARLAASQADFERYFEQGLPRFPTVFYGLHRDLRPATVLGQTFERTRQYYPLLGEEYFRHGVARTSADFDDRSTAFGVASVCYSHAVTDLVNLYYYIWREAGGDVRTASVMSRGNLIRSDVPQGD